MNHLIHFILVSASSLIKKIEAVLFHFFRSADKHAAPSENVELDGLAALIYLCPSYQCFHILNPPHLSFNSGFLTTNKVSIKPEGFTSEILLGVTRMFG